MTKLQEEIFDDIIKTGEESLNYIKPKKEVSLTEDGTIHLEGFCSKSNIISINSNLKIALNNDLSFLDQLKEKYNFTFQFKDLGQEYFNCKIAREYCIDWDEIKKTLS